MHVSSPRELERKRAPRWPHVQGSDGPVGDIIPRITQGFQWVLEVNELQKVDTVMLSITRLVWRPQAAGGNLKTNAKRWTPKI